MRMKKALWVALALIVALSVITTADAVTVVDTTGRTVTVPQPVEHIVSAYGIGTYYVYALGAGDRLVAAWYVAVKSASQAPAAFSVIEPRLSQILSSGDPNVEDLVARGTDLVLADASKYASLADQMQGLGVPTLLLGPETAQGVVDTTLTLGAVLGDEAKARAASLVSDFYRVYGMAAVAASDVASSCRPRVLFLGTSLSQVASGAMYQTQLIEAAGGISVSADLTGSWNTVNVEQILAWNPDVIIVAPYGNVTAADILSNPDWHGLRAVQSGRVFKMPRIFGPMDTPLPESLLGLEWLASVFYPQRALFDVRSEALSFYQRYYNYTLSPAEADSFLVP